MGVAAVMTATVLCGTIRYTAQGQDAGKPVPLKAMAKDADPDWEVVTVKPSDPDDKFLGPSVPPIDETPNHR